MKSVIILSILALVSGILFARHAGPSLSDYDAELLALIMTGCTAGALVRIAVWFFNRRNR